MMASARNHFETFEAYDFLGDEKFSLGWENIRKTIIDSPEVESLKLLEAKVFYFSK